jgi:hypothetical protein
MLHKKKLLSYAALISLLSACGSQIPAFPAVWQCTLEGSPRAFYCVNTKTLERKKVSVDSPAMKGAQALSRGDYLKSEKWIEEVKQIAEQRCD